MRLYLALRDQDGLLVEEGTEIPGNIVHNGFLGVDQGEDQARLPGVVPTFVNLPALLHAEGEGHIVRITHATKHTDIFFAFKKLCVGGHIVQPYIDL